MLGLQALPHIRSPEHLSILPSPLDMDDHNAPAFQDFVMRVQPLPPIPTTKRRASSTSAPRSETPRSLQGRRSSSVYSQWGHDDVSLHSSDFADIPPMPTLPMLQPLAYSASTPQLIPTQETPPLLQPRTYSPLIASPSPLSSQPPTPSPRGLGVEQADYSSTQPKASPVMRIIPLERAISAAHGAIPLLPEEHRARKMNKSRSQEAMTTALGSLSSKPTPVLPEPLVLIDSQGRPRSVVPPRGDGGGKFATFDNSIDPYDARHAFSQELQQKTATEDWAISEAAPPTVLGLHDFEEPRGRTLQRISRRARERKPRPMDSSLRAHPDAQTIANEYHGLLPQYRDTSSNRSSPHNTYSDDTFHSKARMVPSPLFQTPAHGIGHKDAIRFDEQKSASSHFRSNYSGCRTNSNEPIEYFPRPYNLSTERGHKRTSTSGSIPISPPTTSNVGFPSPGSAAPLVTSPRSVKPGAPRYNRAASAYYPHVAPRKTKPKTKTRARTAAQKQQSSNQGEANIAAKILAPLKIKSVSDMLEEKRRRSSASSNTGRPTLVQRIAKNASEKLEEVRRRSSTSSIKLRQPLMQRIAHTATKYTDLFSQPENSAKSEHDAITVATISPGSPHLTPISPKTAAKEVHLGWSDSAKAIFDNSVSPTFLSTKPILYTHVTTPARPLDESTAGLKEEAEAPRRKSSIFVNFLDSWKESKAEKRRQDLKKTIKVLPNVDGSVKGGMRRSSSFGWM